MDSSPLCFTCGLPIEDPPELHVLEDGEPCPACRARALDALPPLVPGFSVEVLHDEAPGPELALPEEQAEDLVEPYEGDQPA